MAWMVWTWMRGWLLQKVAAAGEGRKLLGERWTAWLPQDREVNASPPLPSSTPPLACDCSCIWTLWLSCFVFFFLSHVETPEGRSLCSLLFSFTLTCLLLIFGMAQQSRILPLSMAPPTGHVPAAWSLPGGTSRGFPMATRDTAPQSSACYRSCPI